MGKENAILGSSDAFVGRVGGVTGIVNKTGAQVGVSSAAYATGDVIGDLSPITADVFRMEGTTNVPASGVLQSIIIKDLSKQSLAIDVVIFNANPSATTFTDNSALDIADADIDKVIGVVSVLASDYAAFNDSSVATKTGIGLPVSTASGTKIWFCLVSRGAPTYVADELSIAFGILQD